MCEVAEAGKHVDTDGDENLSTRTSENVHDADAVTRSDSVSFPECTTLMQSNTDSEDKKSCRNVRNVKDKQRRDRMNCYIGELAGLVAPPTPNIKKREKAAVLKLAVNYLRLHHDLPSVCKTQRWQCPFETVENLGVALLESIGGFLFIVSKHGTLMFVSDAIESQLGHIPAEIIGLPISSIVHPQDLNVFKMHLSTIEQMPQCQAGKPVSYNISCYIRMKQHLRYRRSIPLYEMIHVLGQVRKYTKHDQGYSYSREPEISLIAVGRLQSHLVINDIGTELSQKEYIIRLDMSGNINYSHPNASLVFGYLPNEVQGRSAYTFLPKEDIETMVKLHQRVLEEGSLNNHVARLTGRNGKTVYSRVHAFTCYNTWTKKPEYIVTVHQVVSDKEGKELMMENNQAILGYNQSNTITTPYREQEKIEEHKSLSCPQNNGNSEDNAMSEGTVMSFSKTLKILAGNISKLSPGQRSQVVKLLSLTVTNRNTNPQAVDTNSAPNVDSMPANVMQDGMANSESTEEINCTSIAMATSNVTEDSSEIHIAKNNIHDVPELDRESSPQHHAPSSTSGPHKTLSTLLLPNQETYDYESQLLMSSLFVKGPDRCTRDYLKHCNAMDPAESNSMLLLNSSDALGNRGKDPNDNLLFACSHLTENITEPASHHTLSCLRETILSRDRHGTHSPTEKENWPLCQDVTKSCTGKRRCEKFHEDVMEIPDHKKMKPIEGENEGEFELSSNVPSFIQTVPDELNANQTNNSLISSIDKNDITHDPDDITNDPCVMTSSPSVITGDPNILLGNRNYVTNDLKSVGHSSVIRNDTHGTNIITDDVSIISSDQNLIQDDDHSMGKQIHPLTDLDGDSSNQPMLTVDQHVSDITHPELTDLDEGCSNQPMLTVDQHVDEISQSEFINEGVPEMSDLSCEISQMASSESFHLKTPTHSEQKMMGLQSKSSYNKCTEKELKKEIPPQAEPETQTEHWNTQSNGQVTDSCDADQVLGSTIESSHMLTSSQPQTESNWSSCSRGQCCEVGYDKRSFIHNPDIVKLHQSSLMSLLEESERDVATLGAVTEGKCRQDAAILGAVTVTNCSTTDNKITMSHPPNYVSSNIASCNNSQSKLCATSTACSLSWSTPTGCLTSTGTANSTATYVAKYSSVSDSYTTPSVSTTSVQLQHKQEKLEEAMNAQIEEIQHTQLEIEKHHLHNSQLEELVKQQVETIKGQQAHLSRMRQQLLAQNSGIRQPSSVLTDTPRYGSSTSPRKPPPPSQQTLLDVLGNFSKSRPPFNNSSTKCLREEKSVTANFPQLTSYLLLPSGQKLQKSSNEDNVAMNPVDVDTESKSSSSNSPSDSDKNCNSKTETCNSQKSSEPDNVCRRIRNDFTRYSDQTRTMFLAELQQQPLESPTVQREEQSHSLVKSLIMNLDKTGYSQQSVSSSDSVDGEDDDDGSGSSLSDSSESSPVVIQQPATTKPGPTDQILTMLMDVDIDHMIHNIGAGQENDIMDLEFPDDDGWLDE